MSDIGDYDFLNEDMFTPQLTMEERRDPYGRSAARLLGMPYGDYMRAFLSPRGTPQAPQFIGFLPGGNQFVEPGEPTVGGQLVAALPPPQEPRDTVDTGTMETEGVQQGGGFDVAGGIPGREVDIASMDLIGGGPELIQARGRGYDIDVPTPTQMAEEMGLSPFDPAAPPAGPAPALAQAAPAPAPGFAALGAGEPVAAGPSATPRGLAPRGEVAALTPGPAPAASPAAAPGLPAINLARAWGIPGGQRVGYEEVGEIEGPPNPEFAALARGENIAPGPSGTPSGLMTGGAPTEGPASPTPADTPVIGRGPTVAGRSYQDMLDNPLGTGPSPNVSVSFDRGKELQGWDTPAAELLAQVDVPGAAPPTPQARPTPGGPLPVPPPGLPGPTPRGSNLDVIEGTGGTDVFDQDTGEDVLDDADSLMDSFGYDFAGTGELVGGQGTDVFASGTGEDVLEGGGAPDVLEVGTQEAIGPGGLKESLSIKDFGPTDISEGRGGIAARGGEQVGLGAPGGGDGAAGAAGPGATEGSETSPGEAGAETAAAAGGVSGVGGGQTQGGHSTAGYSGGGPMNEGGGGGGGDGGGGGGEGGIGGPAGPGGHGTEAGAPGSGGHGAPGPGGDRRFGGIIPFNDIPGLQPVMMNMHEGEFAFSPEATSALGGAEVLGRVNAAAMDAMTPAEAGREAARELLRRTEREKRRLNVPNPHGWEG